MNSLEQAKSLAALESRQGRDTATTFALIAIAEELGRIRAKPVFVNISGTPNADDIERLRAQLEDIWSEAG